MFVRFKSEKLGAGPGLEPDGIPYRHGGGKDYCGKFIGKIEDIAAASSQVRTKEISNLKLPSSCLSMLFQT